MHTETVTTCPRRTPDGCCEVAQDLVQLVLGEARPVPIRDPRGCVACLKAGDGAPPEANAPTTAVRSFATAALDDDERADFLARTRGGSVAPAPEGVGTELAAILQARGFRESSGCSCRRLQRELDAAGPDVAEDRLDEFTGRMVENYTSAGGWTGHARAAGPVATAVEILREGPTAAVGLLQGRSPAEAVASKYMRRACEIIRRRERLRIVAIVPLFNPAGFQNRPANYLRAIAHYQTLGFDRVVTIEAVYPGQTPQAVGDRIVIEATDNQRLWQKERLINLAIDDLHADPPDAVAWLDADLEWTTGRLASRISTALQRCDVVQPFEIVELLDPDGQTMNRQRSWKSDRRHDTMKSAAPGMAWAARWEWIAAGLFDTAVLGGGDKYMVCGWGGADDKSIRQLPPALQASWELWRSARRPRIGFVPTTCRHHWHGWFRDRLYDSRTDILRRHQCDPLADLRIASNGLWEWTGTKPALSDDIAGYFYARQEDGSR